MDKKIEINKDKVIRLYTQADYTTYQISDMMGCHRSTISRILKQNGVRIKRHKRAYSFYYEQSLSAAQSELIQGSLLGDGGVYKHHVGENGCRFMETHGIDQLEYLQWKKSILENFISSDIAIKDNSNNNTFGHRPTCVLSTVLHKDFSFYRENFYADDVKIVPYFKLTPLSLAVWFYDDGSVSRNGKSSWFATFHTESFDPNDLDVLRLMLKESFNIDSFVVNVRGKYQIIRLNHKNYMTLCEIISSHTVECMAYKNKLFDNPVETRSFMGGVSALKYVDANTHSSLIH